MELLNKRPLFTAILAFLISAVISVSILHKKILFFVFIGILIIFLAITILFGCLKKLNISKSLIRTIILVVVFSLISSLYQYAYSSTRFEGDSGKPIENASIIATIEEISYSKNNSTFFIAKTESVNDDKVNEKFKFEYFGKEELSVGDVLECEGTVTPLYSYKITSGDSYDAAKGASAIVSEVHDLKVTKETNSIYKSLSIISSYIQSKISSACESDGGDFIVSLILGNKYALDSNIRADFKVLGISHILAISGMHISILMFGIQYILSTFNFKKWLRIAITIAFTFLYVGISGFAASALRAAFMLCVVSLAKLSRRDNDSYTSLALAIGTIIILQPYSVYDLGLWLSFLATLGILVALPFIKEKSQTRHAKIINAILNYTRASLYMSLFVFIFTLPVVCFAFGYISTLMPISNLIFSAITEILMYFSFLIPIFFFWKPYVRFCGFLSECIIKLADVLADFPYTTVSVLYPMFIVAMAVFSIYFSYLLLKKSRPAERILAKIICSFCALALVLVCCVIYSNRSYNVYYELSPPNDNEYIVSQARGEVTVFDISNASNSSAYHLSMFSINNKINEIDNFVILHYTASYAKSISKLSSYITVKNVLLPTPINESEFQISENIIKSLEEQKINYSFYDSENAPDCEHTQFRVVRVDDEKFAYFLQIKTKNTSITYFTPYVFNCLEEIDIPTIAENSDVFILGSYGGTYKETLNFSIPESVTHFIMSNEEIDVSDYLAFQIQSVDEFSLFDSTKITVK